MPELDIIFENKDYMVINKQAGLITEKSKFEDCTIEGLVYTYFSQTKKSPFLGIIHRLDRVTSGVLIFAKKKSTLVKFNQLFSQRKIQKTYYAIVQNKPRNKKETLTNYLIKNQKEKRAEITEGKIKDSLTCVLTYEVLSENQFGYLLKIQLKTGRFHQIRAQLSHIGLPIVGDKKYGSTQKYLPLSIGLHAGKLSFFDDDFKKEISFEAPLPYHEFWNFNLNQ